MWTWQQYFKNISTVSVSLIVLLVKRFKIRLKFVLFQINYSFTKYFCELEISIFIQKGNELIILIDIIYSSTKIRERKNNFDKIHLSFYFTHMLLSVLYDLLQSQKRGRIIWIITQNSALHFFILKFTQDCWKYQPLSWNKNKVLRIPWVVLKK